MTPYLIDTHCHLHFPPYDQDLEAVLSHMAERGIWGITIGTALANSQRGISFAEAHPNIWATVGLHPEHVTSTYHDPNEGEVNESTVDAGALEALARSSSKVVAIGETGLDFFRINAEANRVEAMAAQEREFFTHIHVAQKVDLPIVIHCREALRRLAEMVQEEVTAGRRVRGVVHSFTGTWDEAKPLLDLGLYIAVNGIATFPLKKTADPANAIDRTIERIPLDRLMLETDAPYLAPAAFRGKRNEPAWVEEVAKHVAQVRGVDVSVIAAATTKNAQELFKFTG